MVSHITILLTMQAFGYEDAINSDFLPPRSLWLAVEPLLPQAPKLTKVGRRPKADQQMFAAIYYRMRTGCQWNAIPKCLGAASTVHDRHQQWVAAGVFKQLWEHGLLQLNVEGRLDFAFQSIDGCSTKAPLGGEQTGPNPTDRGKTGTKRHILTDTSGLPISLLVTGANVHDKTQAQALLAAMPFLPPAPQGDHNLHFCADKAYDSADIRSTIGLLGYQDHIKSRGQEHHASQDQPGYRARRWVCERSHSWLNKYRALLVRWEKKVANYKALLFLACAHIVWKRSIIFG